MMFEDCDYDVESKEDYSDCFLKSKQDVSVTIQNWIERGHSVAQHYCNRSHAEDLYFRRQHIWLEAMDELMSKGMSDAEQGLLVGCSAGGLASILHCDQFRQLFP